MTSIEEGIIKEDQVLTRKKHEQQEGLKNNPKIDKNQIKKNTKKIVIPLISKHEEEYKALIGHKKKQFEIYKNQNPGYIRYFEFKDRFPRGDIYESDQRDINFLREMFSKEFENNLTDEQILNLDIVKQFEKVIIYLEETEDQDFKNFPLKNSKFNVLNLEQIYGHWINKCKLFKRPLLRKNWKVVLTKDKYGTYNPQYKAFHIRAKEEKKHTRKVTRMDKTQQKQILIDLKKENVQALQIQRLVILREKMKLLHMKSLNELQRQDLTIISEELTRTKNTLFKNSEKYFIQEVIEKPVIVRQVQPTNILPQIPQKQSELKCIQFLVASTVKYLNKYGFKLKDFSTQNISAINQRIQEQNQDVQVSEKTSEKLVDIIKPQKQQNTLNNLFLLKRYSISDHSVYIDKIQAKEILEKQKNYNLDNFEEQRKILSNLTNYENNYNHIMLRTQIQTNPLTYCGEFHIQQQDAIMEKVKIKVNQKLKIFYEMKEEPLLFPRNNYSLKDEANKQIQDLDLETKMKNFRKKKKKLNNL